MRYESYREAIAVSKEGMDSKTSKEIGVGVMLGHHRGDLRENVLSNAHKGGGPLDLSGMTAVSTNDGVTIYRPLLPLEKSFVLDYAHKFGVPYFKGTYALDRES
jgi:tRNA(Ile)-lysidine synthase TilS/MesJ